MLFLLFLAIASATEPEAESVLPLPEPTLEPCHTCIPVNQTCFNITYLFDFDAPFRKEIVIHKIGILRSQNILFYSFEPRIEDEEYYKVGFVNLSNFERSAIISGSQILNFGTFDMDQENEKIYFGGSDGIFVLDTKSNTLSSYSSRGDTVSNIFYKTFVYFSKLEDKGVILKNGNLFKTLVDDFYVEKFVVTKNNVLVFLSKMGLFVNKGPQIHRLSKNAFFRGIAIDLDDNVYAWWIDGLYKVVIGKDLSNSTVVKVANLPDIGALGFDNNNNILFTNGKSLYIMVATADVIC